MTTKYYRNVVQSIRISTGNSLKDKLQIFRIKLLTKVLKTLLDHLSFKDAFSGGVYVLLDTFFAEFLLRRNQSSCW